MRRVVSSVPRVSSFTRRLLCSDIGVPSPHLAGAQHGHRSQPGHSGQASLPGQRGIGATPIIYAVSTALDQPQNAVSASLAAAAHQAGEIAPHQVMENATPHADVVKAEHGSTVKVTEIDFDSTKEAEKGVAETGIVADELAMPTSEISLEEESSLNAEQEPSSARPRRGSVAASAQELCEELKVLAKRHAFRQAAFTFRNALSRNDPDLVNLQVIRVALPILTRLSWPRTISETLEFMNAHNIEAPVPIYNCAFAGLMRDGRADTIERTIEKMWAMQGFSHPNAASYNYLISASFCGGNVEKAFGVLQDMKKRMIYPSFGTYHTLIAGCVRVGDPHRGFETLLAVEQQRFEMSALTIGQVMVACADADDISAVSQLITRFEDALGRYVHELDNLIDRRARRETSDSVHRPSQVERGEPKLEISGLMALLHSAYRGAQPNIAERAMSWFKEWYPEYRVPASAWYCLIGSYALAGDCPSAFDAIARMRTAGYTPMTKELHESLIKPLSTHLEKVDEQFYRLADRLASAKPPAVSQTPSALNNSSSGQADVSDDAVAFSEDAGQHRQEMNEGSAGGSPVPSSEDRASSDTAAKDVNASLSESVISNKPDGGSKIIPDAISGDNAEILDVGIDEMNCIIAACSLAGDLERAFQTYDEAQRYGLNRNVDTFNSLLMGCVVTRHAKGALRIADEMKECNVPFNDETVFLLTRLFMRLGAFDDALRTMEEATNNGVELSTGTFQIIARKCFRIGRRDDVKKIVALAEQNGITSEAVFGRVESHFLRGSDEEEGGDDSDALEVSSRSSLVGYDGNGADGPDAETMPEGRTAGPTSWNEDKQVGTAGGKVLV